MNEETMEMTSEELTKELEAPKNIPCDEDIIESETSNSPDEVTYVSENDLNDEFFTKENSKKVLLEEIKVLKEEIEHLEAAKEEMLLAKEKLLKIEAERKELLELFPNADPEALPDGVAEYTKRGLPLAAAYAMYERRELLRTAEISNHNDNVKKSCFSRIKNRGETEFFSPSEVRVMSKDEIRKNYKNIIQSMKTWH